MRTIDKRRNLGIIAHVDAGKTTLTERLLYLTGQIHHAGDVDSGNTVTDFDEREKKHGITISSSVVVAQWQHKNQLFDINIIDTPGHIDFIMEVESALSVLDGAVAVFCASAGVQPQSENVWNQAERHGIPKIAFINKMDKIGANFYAVVEAIEKQLGATPLPLQMPIGAEDNFKGVIDLIQERALFFSESGNIEKQAIPMQFVEQANAQR